MKEKALNIRESDSDDLDSIRSIHQSAFPEAERDSVTRLAVELARTVSEPAMLSLLAEDGDEVVGHVVFSPVTIADGDRLKGYILSPLAVKANAQRGGIGSALVKEGLRRLDTQGVGLVLVYGDPAYYGRFGFRAELGELFIAPHPLSYAFGWQAMSLGQASQLPETPVRIVCAAALDDPAMW